MSNSWNTVINTFTLFGMEQPGHIPQADELISLVNLAKAFDQGYEWFYVRAQPKNKLVKDVPNKIDG